MRNLDEAAGILAVFMFLTALLVLSLGAEIQG